jgi:hypothetical protein
MSDDARDEIFDRVGDDRRAFLKKMVIGSAFAVPVVSTFSLTGMQASFAQSATSSKPAVAPESVATTAAPTTAAPTTTTTSTTTTTTTTTSTTVED